MKQLNFLLQTLAIGIFCLHSVSASNLESSSSSQAMLRGDYGGTVSRKFYIGVYRDKAFQLVDSLMISDAGILTVPLQNDWRGVIIVACGDYESSWQTAFQNANPETSLQFVFDGQDIEYQTSWRHQSYPAYLKYGKGSESTIVLKELKMNLGRIQEKTYYMEKLLEKTSRESDFYKALQEELSKMATQFNTFCDSISADLPVQSFMRLYVQQFKQVVPSADLPMEQRPAWMAQHLFDYCDLQNPLTVHVPLFADKIRHYLYLNMPVGMTPSEDIERSQKEALERLQAECSFPLPMLQSREQQMREQILAADMDELYSAPEYRDVVNSWLGFYNSGKFRSMFSEDMLTVLDKVNNAEIFTGFANDLLTICTQFGWDDDGAQIASYLSENTARLQNPTGIIQRAVASGKLQPGKPAPAIVGLDDDARSPLASMKTLLVFYESGCNHCNQVITQLTQDYEEYRSNNIRVVTISSDNDKDVYEYHASTYPWPDKLCDFKGYAGENFQNYGILGTPTMFLIDENGTIQGQYVKLEDAAEQLRKERDSNP